jgi:hypothetical protein
MFILCSFSSVLILFVFMYKCFELGGSRNNLGWRIVLPKPTQTTERCAVPEAGFELCPLTLKLNRDHIAQTQVE